MQTVPFRGQRAQTGSATGSTDRARSKRRSTQLELFKVKTLNVQARFNDGLSKDGRELLRIGCVGASEIGL